MHVARSLSVCVANLATDDLCTRLDDDDDDDKEIAVGVQSLRAAMRCSNWTASAGRKR